MDEPTPKPSIEEAPKLELKILSENLKYVYLGPSETLFVIIVSDLYQIQEEKFLAILREN